MQTKLIKKQAETLLKKNIKIYFRSTDMGSGYYFKLVSPFSFDIIDSFLYLDLFEGENEDDYKEWKEDLLDSSLLKFIDRVKVEYLDYFIEYIQQKNEIELDY